MTFIQKLAIGIILIASTLTIHETEAQGRGRRVFHPVVVRKAHVRYAAMPRWGTVVAVRPATAVAIRGTRRNRYYFHNGIYYSPRRGSYVVVRPSPGLRIRSLPAGYRTVVVGPRNYYYYYGTFYTKASDVDQYDVVEAPEGAIVDALPDGYEIKTVGNNEYYFLDGIYYAEVDAPEFADGVGYEVVRI
ncbi:hypothetical protein BH10BAC4_BH10BAC4_12610 [soil metagenome]